ncbi:MAG: single-stranded DNA-binding protein [Phycisphaeraceae bacterium]|nr:single-stranded DNA-binding protein [Phycisphaeraceae bacterium]
MDGYNRVTLMGNLTRDPELRRTKNDRAVCNIGLAVNRTYRDADNERQEEVTFVDADAWGRTAEVIDEFFEKGKPILVEGRLRLDQWEDENGQNRSKLKVVIDRFNFVGGAPADEGGSGGRLRSGRSGGGGRNGRRRQPARGGAR